MSVQIGIDSDSDLVYESSGGYGRALWPTPILTPAKIVFASEGKLQAETPNTCPTQACRFREDRYDPIARIRRGRFYSAKGVRQQPMSWKVQSHPALSYEVASYPNGLQKSLHTLTSYQVSRNYIEGRTEQPLVLLGDEKRFTVWTIINVEAMYTGEDLVTLKARSSLGVLPEIESKKIPKAFRARVEESLNAFADEVHRSAPVSVIDRARDAASQVLLAYFKATGKDARDLARLASRLDEEEKVIAAGAARIIARLHARAKPSERERRKMRAIREQDAELATQCVGTILCELGWADWA